MVKGIVLVLLGVGSIGAGVVLLLDNIVNIYKMSSIFALARGMNTSFSEIYDLVPFGKLGLRMWGGIGAFASGALLVMYGVQSFIGR